MNSYSKISLALLIEILTLSLINLIIKCFIYPEFNALYIVLPQFCLLTIQIIVLVMEVRDMDKQSNFIENTVKIIKGLEYELDQLSEQNENLKQLEKEHRWINGEIIEEKACLHCGTDKAAYCEKCYQELIAENLRLQLK